MRLRATTVLAVVLGLLAAAAPPGAAVPPPFAAVPRADAAAEVRTTHRRPRIPVGDGVSLESWITEPAAPGPHPLVLFPTSWDTNAWANVFPAARIAQRGYVVVSYTPRGFGASDGRFDAGGPLDVGDVSAVLDWALAHTDADPGRVGITGLSLGAALSLLGAAHEPRLKAAAALSAWADLEAGFRPNDTRKATVMDLVYRSATQGTGRVPSAEAAELFDTARDDPERFAELAGARSPVRRVAQINRNGTAVFLAHDWNDVAYPSDQMIDFYGRLTVPKRLELRPGDHASALIPGMFGADSPVWNAALRWLDAHVAGTDTSLTREPPLMAVIRGPQGPPVTEHHADWASFTGRARRCPLGGREGLLLPTGDLCGSPDATWSDGVTVGLNRVATPGLPMVGGYFLEHFIGTPPNAPLALVDRHHAGVWHSGRLDRTWRLRGRVSLSMEITPGAPGGSVFAYLYDMESGGRASLIDEAPFSWRDATPGRPFTLDLDIAQVGYDVPAGHRLALVVTTDDYLYASRNEMSAPMSFGSTGAAPAALTVTVR
ncbi:CocE/NonD family hydrolase [Streptomyces sp. TRM 70351]|uniref:S15 peptidase family protein n=1 Tax=Streptomyces sp. TRM 70351 TaxID=3116552 RepID=UPI002E7C47ED|nr:CocE/NonD family hydrolase [Streptomyces sp. TRM 70351]MEE1928578.1 CocE/NonD family hydrolase [Streptomyces sp. TRM 70351]